MVRIQFKNYYYEGEVNEKGEPHGYGIEYHDSGLIFNGMYKDGKENGPSIAKYTNGESLEVCYVDGKKNGPCKWYLNGDLTDEGEYDNGKKSGYWVMNEKNLHTEGTYVNDLKEGRWIIEDFADGSVFELCYHEGKMNGPSIFVTREGNCTACEYRDDLEIGHCVDNYSDGSYEEGEYVNGLMEGYWTTYYPDGSTVKVRFHKGKLKGGFDVFTNDGDEVSLGFKGGLLKIKGRSADGKRFGMTMNDNGDGCADIVDKDGTKVSGSYHGGREYGKWSVSDKGGTAEMDLTGGKVNSAEYKEKKKGFLARLFGKKR